MKRASARLHNSHAPPSPTPPGPVYAAYAALYDALGQSQWGLALARFTLDTLLPRYDRHPLTALDLACGTGAVAVLLASAGLRVVGLDRSRAMLQVARARAARHEGVAFVRADVRAFAFATHFDLVMCCYDSLNYLTEPAELRAAFGHVRNALAPDGIFICDLVTARAFAGADDEALDLSVAGLSWSTDWDAASRQAVTTITCAAVREGRTFSNTEYHFQRAYERPEVEAALAAAGLRPLGAFAGRPFNEPTLTPPGDETMRIIYVAERTDHG